MSRTCLFNRTSCLCVLALIIAGSLPAAEPAAPGAAQPPRPASTLEPTYDAQADVPAKLDAIEQEESRLRRAGATSRADSLATTLKRLRDRLDGRPSPTTDPEVHVVGVYEGLFPNGPRKFGQVSVEVGVVDAPVTLVLCAYSPVRWDLRLADGVKLNRLILSGYGEQELLAPIEGVAAETFTRKGKSRIYFQAYDRKDDSYAHAEKAIRELTGSPISTFVGAYRPRNGNLVVGPQDAAWRRQRVLTEAEPLYMEATAISRAHQRERFSQMKFQAIHWTIAQRFRGTAEWGEFTPTGPIDGTLRALPQHHRGAVTVDPRGPTFYAIRGDLARIDLANNKVEQLEIEGDLPELSHPCGLAFDTKRNRVILTSKGGEGFMYSYEPDRNHWSLLRSMKDVDMYAVAYAPDEDCLYGLTVPFGGNREAVIYQFDPDGRERRVIRPSMRIAQEPGRWHEAPTQLVSLGQYIAVLDASPDGGPMTCMMIDKKTGQTVRAGPMRPVAASRPNVTDEELTRLWEALGEGEPGAAREAEQAMAGGGQRSVEFIRARMQAAKPAPADDAEVDRLIKQLDAEQARDREEAATALRHMGGVIEPHLRKARQGQLSAEAATRVELLLRQITSDDAASLATIEEVVNPDARREARAIRVLAHIGTRAAVELLRELAITPAHLARARYARAALREP